MYYLINGLYYVLSGFLSLISLNIILSWFPMIYRFKFFAFLRKITDAYMEPFYGKLVLGMFDFTPIIGIVVFEFIIRAFVTCVNF